MPSPNTTLWLGTEESFEAYQAAVLKLAGGMEMDADGLPSLIELQGDVAVVHATGSLIEGHAGFLRYYGVTGYADLEDAGIAAVSNPDVKAIVLSVRSNGGHVHGVQDAAALFTAIDQVKPVVTHTPSDMKSAGMWMGSAARRVFGAPTSESGSIGVLAIHAEKTKALEQDGIKVTVVRAGSSKALANPYEPLSAKAEASMQEGVDYMHGLFKAHMAERRGMSAGQIEKVGQGQVYIGQQAVDAGLIDEVGSLADAITYARGQVSRHAGSGRSLGRTVDSAKGATHNLSTPEDQNMKYTPAQIAALASGVPLADVLKMAPEGDNTGATKSAEELAAEAAAAAAETTRLAAEAAAAETARLAAEAAEAAEAAKPTTPAPDVQTFLAGQVATLGEQLGAAKAKITQLETDQAKSAEAYSGLCVIAQTSLGRMQVALGGSATASTLTGLELLAEHKRVSDSFSAKFPVGGVAATTPPKDAPVKTAVNPMFAHLVASVPKN